MTGEELVGLLQMLTPEQRLLEVEVAFTPSAEHADRVVVGQSLRSGPAPIYTPPGWRPWPRTIQLWLPHPNDTVPASPPERSSPQSEGP